MEKEGLNHETFVRELGLADQEEDSLVSGSYEPLTSQEEETEVV